ncbi:MAG TPA: hypothetical protein VG273_21915 [Bryobacteraceae bacterium]|nr:hypothetical protein [Bryobacteraceae bacterium]
MKKLNTINTPKGIPATATVVLGNASYGLAYDFAAIADTEREAGVSLLRGLEDIGNLTARELRGLLLAGIRAVDPSSTLTIIDVGKLINVGNIFAVTEAIAKTILAAMPEKVV